MDSEERFHMREKKVRSNYKGGQVNRLNIDIDSEFVRMECNRNECKGTVSFNMQTDRGNHFGKCNTCSSYYKLRAEANYRIETDWGVEVANIAVDL